MSSSVCPPARPPALSPQAFDEHLNMVLGDVEERHVFLAADGSTKVGRVGCCAPAVRPSSSIRLSLTASPHRRRYPRASQTDTRQFPMLFLRGDTVILVSPPLRMA